MLAATRVHSTGTPALGSSARRGSGAFGSGRSRRGGGGGGAPHTHHHRAKPLTFWPLVALIFYEVSGGPFGIEDAVGAAGPLPAIIGFAVLPLLWSVPEALITAELATAFPEDAGFVAWVTAAFGPGLGFQEGWWSWASGVADNAVYPVLFASYVEAAAPGALGGWRRPALTVALSLVGAYVNYRGLGVVGKVAVVATIAIAAPFLALVGAAAPRVQPANWAAHVPWGSVRWGAFFNVMFWNLNYWDSISTLAGEVAHPGRTFPRALAAAVVLVVTMYLLPLLAGTGILPPSANPGGGDWSLGYFAEVGRAVGGKWLAGAVVAAAAVSAAGQFEAEMSSDAFLLLGMAQRGFLPARLAARSKHGTPGLAIALSASGVLLLAPLSFLEIVDLLNFVYCLAELLEFGAFLALRVRAPRLARPFRVPLGTVGCALMLTPATILLVGLLLLPIIERNWRLLGWTAGAVGVGLALQAVLAVARARGWCHFLVPTPHDFRELLVVPEDEEEMLVGGGGGGAAAGTLPPSLAVAGASPLASLAPTPLAGRRRNAITPDPPPEVGSDGDAVLPSTSGSETDGEYEELGEEGEGGRGAGGGGGSVSLVGGEVRAGSGPLDGRD